MPPHIRADALPAHVRSGDVLHLLGHVRAATPAQLGSLLSRQRPGDISLNDDARMRAVCQRLRRRGLVEVRLLRVESKSIRSAERASFRVTQKGRGLALAEKGRTRRTLEEIQKLQGTDERWVEADRIWHTVFPGFAELSSVRKKLRALVRQGYLQELESVAKGYVEVVMITAKGDDEVELRCLARGVVPPTRTGGPNSRQVVHHLMTLHVAIGRVAQSQSLHLVGYETEEVLRSKIRAGEKTRAGQAWDVLPDARVTVLDSESPSYGPKQFAVEVINRSYGEEDIRAKYSGLAGDGTVFAASTQHVAKRVESLGFPRPLTLADFA